MVIQHHRIDKSGISPGRPLKGRLGLMSLLVVLMMLVFAGTGYAEPFRFVDVTGRATLPQSGDTDTARRLALEDALYQAALEGGADIVGYQASVRDQMVSDELVVRPSGSILNYTIVEEAERGEHYIVSIRAAVGSLPEITCQNRPFSKAMIFAPEIAVSPAVPASIAAQVPVMLNHLSEVLQQQKTLGVTLAMNTPYQSAGDFSLPSSFDYKAITEGRRSVDQGDFAVIPVLEILHRKSNTALFKKEEAIAILRLKVLEGGAETADLDLHETVVMPLGTEGPIRSLSVLSRPRRADVTARFLAPIPPLVDRLTKAINCRTLKSTLRIDQGELFIPIGSNQGLRVDAMGVLDDPAKPVQFLSIARLEPSRTVLAPLDPYLPASSLVGRTIEFLEFKP